MQTRDLRLLLEALTTPERSLDTFVVHPMDDKTGALASPMHVLQTVHFNSFSESQIIDLTHPLQNLRSLQLKLVDSSLDMLTRFWADEYGKLEVFLSRLQNLEHLYLCCWTIPRQNGRRSSIIGELPNDLYFPRLRSLSLNSFWMEAWGLSNFLLRHTSTLEEIELLHMNLFFNKSNGTTVYIHEKGEGVNRIESVKSLWMDTEWDESIDGPDLYAARNTTREADEVDEGTADSEALEDSTAQQTQLPHACEVRPNLAGPGIAKTGKSKILSLSPWKLVTDTCTTLPKLQGLQLVHPLVSFLPVPPTISRSLEDRGMNGRPNLFR